MRAWACVLASVAVLAGAACDRAADRARVQPAAPTTARIAWREGDVDDAFAEARERDRPVLLYWGARWCPPCNLMKQTLFKDPSFIAATRNFIPVHLDGDAKDAQSWGERFGVSGYPTVIVLRPDRTEVTRLADGSTAAALAQVLRVAARRVTSTEDLLRRADDPARLSADDWRLLASFDWLDDPKHFGDPAKAAAFADRLADAAPDPAIRRHFVLTALAIAGDGDNVRLTTAQAARLRAALPALLADPREVTANRQELSYTAPGLVAALPDPAERAALSARLIAALDRVANDPSVPLGDRLGTINADIVLAKAARGGTVPADVVARVRARVAATDRAATDPMMRQAVIPDAAQALADAGDAAGAERLLRRELPRAVAPYYFMAHLARLAEQAGEKRAAMAWLEQAAETASGPATRVQWAMMYANGVMRLAPDDKAEVERSAGMAIDALARNDAGYAERTAKNAAAWGAKLRAWSARHDGGAVLARLRAKLAQSCAGGASCKDALRI